MESNDKIQSAKKEFDAIAENETANFKITLLEKHLMESREAQQELKQQELELRDKQLAVIADMQKANEEAKAIDRLLADKIDESVQSIKTEMFASWQETVRDALVAETKSLVENKLNEYDTIYRKQNEVIGAQAKLIDKLTVEELPASSRKYPYIAFDMEREVGKDILFVTDVSKTVDGVKLLDKVYFSVNRGDKIAFVGENELAQTALFKILMGELEPDEGSVKWGVSTIRSYLPKDNSPYFDGNQMELVDWLRQYSAKKDDVYLRGFLGRMLFSNEDVFKPVNVLSGGEKVRCMLSRMMLSGANVVLLDQPTNHLDMESIQAVNKGLEAFPGVVLLASHDHELLTSTCNRVIAFQPDGTIIDKYGTYDDYLAWMAERRQQG